MKGILTILNFMIVLSSFAQTANNTERFNELNIYYQALNQYLNFSKSEKNINHDTLFIEDDFKITDSLLRQSGHTKFIKLNFEDLRQILDVRKGLILYRIFPLEYAEGEFSVSFVPFGVTKTNKRNISYKNPGSYRVVFKFLNDKFVFIRIEDHGI